MQIIISTQAAAPVWGDKTLVSFTNEQAIIHVKHLSDHKKNSKSRM